MKPESNESPGADAPEEFSLEDLDKILDEADPEFSKNMQAIKADFVDAAKHVVDLDIQSKDEDDKEINEEDLNFRQKIIFKIKKRYHSRIEKVDALVRPKLRAAKNMSILLFQQGMAFLKYELPERIRYLKSQVSAIKEILSNGIRYFNSLSWQRKAASLAMLLISVSALFLMSRIFVPKWLPRFSIQILQSWSDEGKVLGVVQNREDMINLFEAFPEMEFQVRLTKVVVNLRRDEKSGSNPMALFEFYLGLDAKDTAIEVKDREKEILDLVQRTLEDFTYDEIMAFSGKIRMKAAVRDNINKILNQGSVHRIYINRMVTNN